jgi:hypothetical protein
MKRFRMSLVFASCLFLSLLLTSLSAAQARPEPTASPSSSATSVSATDGVAPAVSGSGTTDYIPLWTSGTALGNSKLYQKGSKVGLGTTTPGWALDVSGQINSSLDYKIAGGTVLATPGDFTSIALGQNALVVNATASYNTAMGYYALWKNTTGVNNVAVGAQAMQDNVQGSANTAVGAATLDLNANGSGNTASGFEAMSFNTGGNYNSAYGDIAMYSNAMGSANTAIGWDALALNTTGSNNTALGVGAITSVSGSNNIAVGYGAGNSLTGGESNNIYVGNPGISGDSGVIRIGSAATQNTLFAAGIYGASSAIGGAIPVLVDVNGQLVTVSSSRRYKEDIQDMGDASSGLMKLRPVTFRYKKPLADGSQPVQYGLIAEEVAEVYPDMVAHSADGQVEAVKYQLLDPMLLNEVQRQHAEIRELQERLSKMEAALAAVSRVSAGQ